MDQRVALLGAGNTIVIAVGAEATDGAFALLDYEPAPGFDILPPHIHRREDEAIYVLEGYPSTRVGLGIHLPTQADRACSAQRQVRVGMFPHPTDPGRLRADLP